MGRPTAITINLSALRHNLQRIRELVPRSSVLAMVKSNGYGHGLERVALALSDADALGVACIEEGMLLRKAGVKNPIVLMEGLFASSELEKAIDMDFSLVVHHVDQIEILEKSPFIKPLQVWFKIDTGMHRLGFDLKQVSEMYKRLMECKIVKKPIILMTHFAEADSEDRKATTQQINCFNEVTKNISGPRSLCNSAGIMAWPEAHADWVRPGIILYGASPIKGHCVLEHGFKPVMSFSTELIAIHNVSKGEKIGYGGTWVCPEDSLIGVIAIGYGDGYPQYAKAGTPVMVNGKICPLVGRVSMDMATVDLRSQPHAKIGDTVLLWGEGLPVEKVAENNHTSAYELLTRITQRVRVQVMGNCSRL
jgi:alanine racemase